MGLVIVGAVRCDSAGVIKPLLKIPMTVTLASPATA